MQTFLVGGAVRDKLLSLPVDERDWVVVGSSPETMHEQGFRQVGKDFPVFLHPDTHEEYALARTERKTGSGHRGFSVHSDPAVTLEQDLLRRDLTINAIAEDEHGGLIDPYGGQEDIKQRVLRHISPAFSEDPLRVLRVARFAARFWSLDFTIAPETLTLMSTISAGDELQQLSKERVWQETKRALASDNPEIYFLVLLQIGALEKICPPLAQALQQKASLLHLASIRNIDDVEFRYACLILLACASDYGFDVVAADEVSQSFINQGDLHEFILLVAKHFSACCKAHSSNSESIYQLLTSLDAFRRESRYLRVLHCIRQAQIIFQTCDIDSLYFLEKIISQLNTIKPDEKIRDQLSGKQIGEHLKALRIEALNEQLAQIK